MIQVTLELAERERERQENEDESHRSPRSKSAKLLFADGGVLNCRGTKKTSLFNLNRIFVK